MAILIVSPKDVYSTKRFIEEAEKQSVDVEIVDIQGLADLRFEVDVNKYDCLYIRFCYPYFEQIANLAKRFIEAGKKVVDAEIANGDVGLGKMIAYEKLSAAGIKIPQTNWLLKAKSWNYPCIVKWTYGFGGKEVFLVKNVDQLKKTSELLPPEELLLQEYINAEYEYKVITVGYKSLPVVLRFDISKTSHRPDFEKTKVIELSLQDEKINQIVQIAEQSSRLLKRELAKVDILESNGKFYVLEVNRWPGLKSFEELTRHNIAKDFVAYLIEK